MPSATPPPRSASPDPYLFVMPAFVDLRRVHAVPARAGGAALAFRWDASRRRGLRAAANYAEAWRGPRPPRLGFVHAFVFIFYASSRWAWGSCSPRSSTGRRCAASTFFRTVDVLAPGHRDGRRRCRLDSDLLAGRPPQRVLDAVGLDAWSRGWLGDYTFALPAVGLIGTWVETGTGHVLLLGGHESDPPRAVRGGPARRRGAVREFVAVTLPSVRGEIAVALTLTVVAALKTFDLIYMTTKWRAGTSTTVAVLQVYYQAFELGRVGHGVDDRGSADGDHLRDHFVVTASATGRTNAGLHRRGTLNYVILIAFAAFALGPVVTIVAFGPRCQRCRRPGGLAGELRDAWRTGTSGLTCGPRCSSRVRRRRCPWCARCWRASRSARWHSAGQPALLPDPARHHDARRGDRRPAVLRPAPARAHGHDLGRRVAPGGAVGRVRHVLDARVLPTEQPGDRRGGAHRRGRDGRILWQAFVPLARPAIVTLVVLDFMWTWNEFLIPLDHGPEQRAAAHRPARPRVLPGAVHRRASR